MKRDVLSESGIYELREATTQLLVELRNNSEGKQINHNPPIKYNMDGGIGWGYPLFKSPELAVQVVWMPKGSGFKQHVHPDPCVEWIFTVYGNYKIIDCPQAGKEFPAKRISMFKPNEPHGGLILADTRILCWTMPGDMEGYPDVGR